MNQSLGKKRALVTGGSRGIGAAIVKRLASEGADVAFTYSSSPEKAAETARAAQELESMRLPFKPIALMRVSNVQPGPIDTEMNPATSEFAETLKKQFMAVPRYGSVAEIAAMVAYLAGPEAGFVTGASLTIDGGFNA
jgi:NAD(P)-dependent dehydrogenase (short-subunit alcohol dehydrogenase family)